MSSFVHQHQQDGNSGTASLRGNDRRNGVFTRCLSGDCGLFSWIGDIEILHFSFPDTKNTERNLQEAIDIDINIDDSVPNSAEELIVSVTFRDICKCLVKALFNQLIHSF